MERLIVADWYKLNPDTVDQWPMPVFSDRQEYMYVKNEITSPEKTPTSDLAPVGPGEVEYKGPKTK